jgi:formate dehydrogenase iron-sulfur subunit
MLDKAHQRLEKIRWEHPNACIYGENELGGLHVLYVLDDSPEAYGLPTNPRRPEDIYALKAILHHVGWGFGILAIVGIGFVHLIAKRKIKVKKH